MAEEQQPIVTENPDDKMSLGLNVLSFFIPIIGAVIYFANKKQYPVKAKAIGRCTLWGFAYGLVYFFMKMLLSRPY